MKRRLISAVLLAAMLCGTACGKKTDSDESSEPLTTGEATAMVIPSLQDDDDVDAHVVLENGTVLTITDDGSIITKMENGLEWNYLSGTLRVMFPLDWNERFYVRGTTVYCSKCYDQAPKTGTLFNIEFLSAQQMLEGGRQYSALLGKIRNFYIVATLPEDADYDVSNTDLFAEYTDLYGDLDGIFQTVNCGDSPSFKPINLSAYEPATESGSSKLFGCWSSDMADANAFSAYSVFRSRDSAFGYYSSSNDMRFGSFYVNKNAQNYVWNTENWGDAGIVFLENNAYRVTYSETEPMRLEFEALFEAEDGDSLVNKVLYYSSDFQQIYPADSQNNGVEMELN